MGTALLKRVMSRTWAVVALPGSAVLILGLAAAPARASTTFPIENINASKCVGIASGGIAGDWYCTGNADQTWHIGAGAAGSGYSEWVNGNGQCLATNGSKGNSVYATACNTRNATELWAWTANDYVVNYTGEILAVSGGSTANGAPLIMWDATGSADQFWRLPGF
jgi:hypothetical protein